MACVGTTVCSGKVLVQMSCRLGFQVLKFTIKLKRSKGMYFIPFVVVVVLVFLFGG